MSTLIYKITGRRAERRAGRRRRAIMLDMMRELNEMARGGLLVPAGMEAMSVEELVDGGWAERMAAHRREGEQ